MDTQDSQTQPSSKRQRTQSYGKSPASSRSTSPMPPPSHKIRDSGRRRPDGDNDGASLPTTSRDSAQKLYERSIGRRKAPQSQTQTLAERTALAEVQELKAELAKARADAAAAVALAADRERTGLGGSVDRLRSRTSSDIFIHMRVVVP
jgi:hypothetical protein